MPSASSSPIPFAGYAMTCSVAPASAGTSVTSGEGASPAIDRDGGAARRSAAASAISSRVASMTSCSSSSSIRPSRRSCSA